MMSPKAEHITYTKLLELEKNPMKALQEWREDKTIIHPRFLERLMVLAILELNEKLKQDMS